MVGAPEYRGDADNAAEAPPETSGGTSAEARHRSRHVGSRAHADPRLHALARRYDLDSLATYLAAPTPPMPAFPLSDTERRDLAVTLLQEY